MTNGPWPWPWRSSIHDGIHPVSEQKVNTTLGGDAFHTIFLKGEGQKSICASPGACLVRCRCHYEERF